MDFFVGMTLILILVVVIIPIAIFYLYSLYKLFEKCNITPWKAFIPFYNDFILIQFVNLNWWYFLIYIFFILIFMISNIEIKVLCLIAILFVKSLINFSLTSKINDNSNNRILYTILLTIIPFVYVPIFGLNEDFKYNSKGKTTPNSYIDLIQTSGRDEDDIKITKSKSDKMIFCSNCGAKIPSKSKFCPNCGTKL